MSHYKCITKTTTEFCRYEKIFILTYMPQAHFFLEFLT